MSDDAAPKQKKKGKLGKMLVMLAGVLVLVGGGVGAGLYAAGAGLVGGDHAAKEDPNKPKLVLKEGAEESHGAPAISKGKARHGADDDGIDRSKYQATYFPIENSFTSNLRDSDGFVQLGIGVSTFYDHRVIENLEKNDMPVRSAVLMTLADSDAFVITTPEGKAELRKALKDSINAVLKEREGFGGIDDVYFTSFIIQ